MALVGDSPLDSLPVELLSTILVLATHASTDPDNTIVFQSDSIKAPLVFSAVNHHWRAVALNTPALWTSLCATVGSIEDNDEPNTASSFNTFHLTSCLRLSRRCSVDVLIDARDQNWDFSEPEIPSSYNQSSYVPPFSVSHMRTVMSLLCPHISRWRTCVILTDTWAPMHVALCSLTKALLHAKADRLESLVLMRCNEYISYAPEFQPPTLKYPVFLDFGTEESKNLALLPKLRQICLRGVHVDWSSLATTLETSRASLESLEMASHSQDVRPPLLDFYTMLHPMSHHLRKLVIHGSGPRIPEGWPLSDIKIPEEFRHSLTFPFLEDLTVGYRSAMYSINMFEMFNLPAIKSLTLEDATHPGDIDDIDAGHLLVYLADGERPVQVGTVAIWTFVDGHPQRTEPAGSPSPPPSSTGENLIHRQPPLAQLERLTLKRVKAHPSNFQYLFLELKSLKHLELSSTSFDPIDALTPNIQFLIQGAVRSKEPLCPCPQLASITMRGYAGHSVEQFDKFVSTLNASRTKMGASTLDQVEVYVNPYYRPLPEIRAQGVLEITNAFGPRVKFVGQEVMYDSDEDEDEEEDEERAFQPGGAFNDPVFDAYYAPRFLS